ncbi:MAG: hypothetical protein NC191_03025 [Muribaculaceae bacterium]|nr:hypothetical protein [Muribaculaceae bacterium]
MKVDKITHYHRFGVRTPVKSIVKASINTELKELTGLSSKKLKELADILESEYGIKPYSPLEKSSSDIDFLPMGFIKRSLDNLTKKDKS